MGVPRSRSSSIHWMEDRPLERRRGSAGAAAHSAASVRTGEPGLAIPQARAGELPHDLLHALRGLAYLPCYRLVKRVDFGLNILAIERELIGDVNQLVGDDPTDAASHRDRNQDRRENGQDAAGMQPLEQLHRWSQQKGQSESKGKGDQNLARKVQGRDRSQQDDDARIAGEFGPWTGRRGRKVVPHGVGVCRATRYQGTPAARVW